MNARKIADALVLFFFLSEHTAAISWSLPVSDAGQKIGAPRLAPCVGFLLLKVVGTPTETKKTDASTTTAV